MTRVCCISEIDCFYQILVIIFRYDPTAKKWKVRGAGNVKILAHPTWGLSRVVLRRAIIYEVVLNHWITGELQIAAMKT
jgi:hypothetical protein